MNKNKKWRWKQNKNNMKYDKIDNINYNGTLTVKDWKKKLKEKRKNGTGKKAQEVIKEKATE